MRRGARRRINAIACNRLGPRSARPCGRAMGPSERRIPFVPIIGGRYELVSTLGVGGMAIVSFARDRITGEGCAVKRPRLRFRTACHMAESLRAESRASLIRERAALARLCGPNVIRLDAFGADENGEPFLVLELIDAPRSIVVYSRSAPPVDRLLALVGMFDALADVHRSAIVHCDVKPPNVLIDQRGAASPGLPAPGSALYSAPEVLCGGRPTVASDLYSAGMIAAEALTGIHPLRYARSRLAPSSVNDFPLRWVRAQRRTLALEPRVASIIESLLAPGPRDRCGSADEVAAGLKRIASDLFPGLV